MTPALSLSLSHTLTLVQAKPPLSQTLTLLFLLGYHNVDIYERRIFECRQQNVEIYGRISLVPMVDYITSKAKVELVSLVIFF